MTIRCYTPDTIISRVFRGSESIVHAREIMIVRCFKEGNRNPTREKIFSFALRQRGRNVPPPCSKILIALSSVRCFIYSVRVYIIISISIRAPRTNIYLCFHVVQILFYNAWNCAPRKCVRDIVCARVCVRGVLIFRASNLWSFEFVPNYEKVASSFRVARGSFSRVQAFFSDKKERGVKIVPAACLWIRDSFIVPCSVEMGTETNDRGTVMFPQSCSVQVATMDSVQFIYLFVSFFLREGWTDVQTESLIFPRKKKNARTLLIRSRTVNWILYWRQWKIDDTQYISGPSAIFCRAAGRFYNERF